LGLTPTCSRRPASPSMTDRAGVARRWR
jgi:hypothetical protein